MKNFVQEQRRIREELAPLLTIYETRTILALSVSSVFELIQVGKLQAFNPTGKKLKRTEITSDLRGIRVSPSSVQQLLEATEVK
jgi:hypothetical protein